MERESSETSPLINDDRKVKNEDMEDGITFYEKYIQPCVAEFIGTTFFVFIGTMSQQNELILGVAIAHGLCIALLIYSFGQLSGGHFNPAITLGVALSRGMEWILVPCYIICQLIGGILGASFTRGCLSFNGNVTGIMKDESTSVYYKIMGGATTLHANNSYDTNAAAGILTEALLTYLLVSVVILTSVDPKTKCGMYGLSIGLSVTVGIVAGGAVTEASMNPARSLGPAVVASDQWSDIWDDHYIYWLGPFLGSCLAALIYRLLLADRDRRLPRL